MESSPLVLLLAFSMIFSRTGMAQERAQDLYCYSCASARSMKHCVLKQKKILCPKGKERCLEVEFRGSNGYGFARDCVRGDHCDEKTLPQCVQLAGNSKFCSFSCCKGDRCNAGSVVAVSGIFAVTGALVSLLVLHIMLF